jgi:hypothetical protein
MTTEFESLAAELRALREEMVAARTPPSNIITRSEFDACPVRERAALIRGKTLIDNTPEPPKPRPPGSVSRAEFDAITSPSERMRVARSSVIVD